MNDYLIINADDFGLTPGVNRGILKAHRKGIVTSTSLMVNTPGFDEAVEFAQRTPSLGVGFHFNLTTGQPLTPTLEQIPSLVDDNGFFRSFHPGLTPNWQQNEVQIELEYQWQRIQQTDLPITHIDSHHYIQRFPQVYKPLSTLAHKQGIPMRHTFAIQPVSQPSVTGFHSDRSALPIDHPKTTDYFIGDEYFHIDGMKRILRHLHQLQPGVTELNCHPGYVDHLLKHLSSWLQEREKELDRFTSKPLREEIKSRNIRLINYHQLHESP